ncbi:MAG TPA: FAD-dependent oxidoreductase [Pusillimonas sp.]|uniref:FAD-dependent oxidoreductase n=1 Tax=Pusillimonas sp. TaxID=3040095 RepID=UPI002C9BDA95|nr:FAD-dependent oxidoreductase [Pusillimonas sp.]HUH86764.1 FAD-dependent oxidoreductase [Pusillimonas sp.]
MTQIKNALIVGAGIAGCSAAIMLASRGVAVTLVEQQTEWRFQSSGIFVYSNGLASLREVGVLEDILAAGFGINDGKNIYLDHLGQPIVDVFYPSIGGKVPPILGIKRAEIHRILAARLSSLGVDILLGTTVSELEPGAAHEPARASLSNGHTSRYDLVIGADGIRSSVRQRLFPAIEPRNTGFGVWRSVHDRPADLDVKIMMMGVGKRLGIMPISDDKLYIFGTVPEPEKHWYPRETWPQVMRDKFSEFTGPVRQFLDQVSDQTEVLYTVVEEVAAPLPWHQGRTLLIGDAAHASTPFMGQGGAMAVADAVELGRTLEQDAPNVPEMLRRFGERRYPECKFVQDASRAVGEAGAVEDPESCKARNAAMQQNSQAHVDGFYAKLAALRQAPNAN